MLNQKLNIRSRLPIKDVSNMGIASYDLAGMATSLMVACKDKVLDAPNAFLSLLAMPNTIIFDKEIGLSSAKYVLDATEFGVITWPTAARMINGKKELALDLGPDAKYEFFHITSLKNLVVQECEIGAPCEIQEKNSDGMPFGIRPIIRTNTVKPMARHSCDNGFPGVIVDHLKKFVKYFEVPCEAVPSLEIDIVKLLVKFMRPTLTDSELAKICGMRGYKTRPKLVFGTVINQDGFDDLVADCMTPDMKQDLIDSAKQYQKSVDAMRALAVDLKPAAKAAAPKKKKKCGAKDLLCQELAKKYLPVITGCSITQETEWHTRWKVSYPTAVLPCTTSACYEDKEEKSMRSAMLYCITWAWAQHELATDGNEVCPFELSA